MSFISTSELDAIARKGLWDIAAVFDGPVSDDTKERAEMALKLLRIGSGRFSAETNRMALAFRVARAIEVPREQMMPLWQQLAGAEAPQRSQESLAGGKQLKNKQLPGQNK